MKILIIKNKGVNDKFYKREVAKLKYFSELKKNFGIDNIAYEITETDSDIPISLKQTGVSTNGLIGYTVQDLEKYLYFEKGFDFVFFVYDGTSFLDAKDKKKKNLSFSRPNPINGAFVSEVTDNSNKNVFTHELIHLFKFKAQALGYKEASEQMDKTLVNGEWKPYYLNDEPTAKDGNYHISLKLLEPYLPLMGNPIKQSTMSIIKDKISEIINVKKVMYKPKDFGISELVSPSVLKRLGEEKCWQLFDERALRNLQWLRERFGITYVNVKGKFTNRGFDDGSFRKNGTSQHNHGRAFDMHFKDYTIEQVHDILKSEYHKMPEPNVWIELTSEGKPITWLHMDVRYSEKKGIHFFNA
jgi:hypothetical protein